MLQGRKIVVVMPAYNAAETIRKTFEEVQAQEVVDSVILVDDKSQDSTVDIAEGLPGLKVVRHSQNAGYGANQKTCYSTALSENADIVIMVHPDYQYTPKLIPALAGMISSRLYSCVIASRILGGKAIDGGMPFWKYLANRGLTFTSNTMMGAKLSEYHSGYRAFSADLLKSLPLESYSDDFVFDMQMLAGILWRGHVIAEVSCPTKYFPEASSINFPRSVRYGIGCVLTSVKFRLARLGISSFS